MEYKVLYDYSAGFPVHFGDMIDVWICLILGFAFLGYAVYTTFFSKEKVSARETGAQTGVAICFLVGVIATLLGVWGCYDSINEQLQYREMLKTGNVETVEGYVEKYHPMPKEGHDSEFFEINGIVFEYSDYEIVNGYHKSASHGGVITHNGQHLLIKYVVEDEPMDDEEEYEDEEYDNEEEPMEEEYIDEEGTIPLYYNEVTDENGNKVWREWIILYIAEIKE